MTVPKESPVLQFDGDGATTDFTIGFTFRHPSDARVAIVSQDGEIAHLKLGVGYTISERTITLASTVPVGAKLRIRRVVEISQETSIRNQGEFYAEIHEEVFDKLTEIDQQQQYDLDGSIKIINSDGTAAGGTLTKRNDSVIAIGSEGNLELIEHDSEVISGEKVDELRRDVGMPDNSANPAGSAFSRIRSNKERLDGLVDGDRVTVPFWTALHPESSLSTFDPRSYTFNVTQSENPKKITNITITGNTTWEYGWGPTTAQGTLRAANRNTYIHIGQAYVDSDGNYQVDAESFYKNNSLVFPIRVLNPANILGDVTTAQLNTKLSHFIFPIRLYRRFTQADLDNRRLEDAVVRLGSNPTSSVTYNYSNDLLAVGASGSSGFGYITPGQLERTISAGGFLYYIDAVVEFDPHPSTANTLQGIVIDWSSRPVLHETTQERMIRSNKSSIAALESRPVGGGSSAKGLRVVAVNDGLPVFDNRDLLPDTMTLTVQTDVAIHGPVSIRLRGQEDQAGITVGIGPQGDETAISPGSTERVTFPLSNDNKALIVSTSQGNNGTADISIYGASASGGTATRQATFAIFIKNSLASMIGPTNREEILVNGLPTLMRNMFDSILAGMTKSYTQVDFFTAGVSISGDTRTSRAVLTADELENFLRADSVLILFGPTQTTNYEDSRAVNLNGFFIDFLRKNTAVQAELASRQGSVRITIRKSTRQILLDDVIGGENSNNYGFITAMSAYIPSYSFTPPSYVHFIIQQIGSLEKWSTYPSGGNGVTLAGVTATPTAGTYFSYASNRVTSDTSLPQATPVIEQVLDNDNPRNPTFIWKALKDCTLRVNALSMAQRSRTPITVYFETLRLDMRVHSVAVSHAFVNSDGRRTGDVVRYTNVNKRIQDFNMKKGDFFIISSTPRQQDNPAASIHMSVQELIPGYSEL